MRDDIGVRPLAAGRVGQLEADRDAARVAVRVRVGQGGEAGRGGEAGEEGGGGEGEVRGAGEECGGGGGGEEAG